MAPLVVSLCGTEHVKPPLFWVNHAGPCRVLWEWMSSFGMLGSPSLTYWYFLVIDHMLETGHCSGFIMLARPSLLHWLTYLRSLCCAVKTGTLKGHSYTSGGLASPLQTYRLQTLLLLVSIVWAVSKIAAVNLFLCVLCVVIHSKPTKVELNL